jgi:hypothetical protein
VWWMLAAMPELGVHIQLHPPVHHVLCQGTEWDVT